MSNTLKIGKDSSSICIFPPMPDPRPLNDTRKFYVGEPICYRRANPNNFNRNSRFTSYQTGTYVGPNINYRTGRIVSHDVKVNGFNLEMVDYRNIGKLELKENVMRNMIEKKIGKTLPSEYYKGYGGKTRKSKKSRKNYKSRKYGRK